MTLALAFTLFIVSVILTLSCGLPMWLAMSAGFMLFFMAGRKSGYRIPQLLGMSLAGAKSSLIVVRVLLTIGVMTGLWRSAGTFAALVALGLEAVTPSMFVLAAFVLPCVLSYALGTSFGTAGTLGVALMTIARGGGVDPVITAGAVMSGIHFGDRGSPSSSCLHLVTALTRTEIFANVRAFMKSQLMPLIISFAFYLMLSVRNPLASFSPEMLGELSQAFNLSYVALLPAVIMLVLPFFRVRIFSAFLASIVTAFAISVWLQGCSVTEAVRAAVFGLHYEGGIRALFNGGGLASMIPMCLVLVISGTFSGIFDGTGMLGGLQEKLSAMMGRFGAYPVLLVTGTLMDAVFCNQTVGVIMTAQLFRRPYADARITDEAFAVNLADGPVITAPIIPWCIACSVPLSMLGADFGAMGYACYLWLIPCWRLLNVWYNTRIQSGKIHEKRGRQT